MNTQAMRAEMLAKFRGALADLLAMQASGQDAQALIIGWPENGLYFSGRAGAMSACGILGAYRFANEYDAARMAARTTNGKNERARVVTIARALETEIAGLRMLIAGLETS